jgi:hypothetical protein
MRKALSLLIKSKSAAKSTFAIGCSAGGLTQLLPECTPKDWLSLIFLLTACVGAVAVAWGYLFSTGGARREGHTYEAIDLKRGELSDLHNEFLRVRGVDARYVIPLV